jgi:UDP-2,3-diacylglucosamine hydrolase
VPATLFVSDLHLCPAHPQTCAQFLAFLKGPAAGASALYILGDLFEYWAGDDDLDAPFNAAVCAAIKHLTGGGTPVFFLPGNRDFLIGEGFASATGTTLLDETCLIEIAGISTLLLHGDTLCTDDTDYQQFRLKVRTSAWQQSFLDQPLAARKAQIEAMRSTSETEKRKKPMVAMDVNGAALAAVLRQYGLPPRLIHGHTHLPAHHSLSVGGQRCERWVLAAWEDTPAYLAIDASGCRCIALGE